MRAHRFNYALELSGEENDALIWRIGCDYKCAGADAFSPPPGNEDDYIAFALNFYTRSRASLDDVVTQYRMYFKEQLAKAMAEAFMHDILGKLRTPVTEAA
jgi:hypothetical protein